MPVANTTRKFGSVTKTLHWLTALLVLANIPIGLVANDMAAALRDPSIPSTGEDFSRVFFLFSLHKTLGVAIFLTALVRILWALVQPRPAPLNAGRRGEAFVAGTVHWLLYGSLVLVPLSGWISHAAATGFAPILWPFGQSLPFVPQDPGLAAFAASLHVLLQRVLAVSVALHVLGALKHHFIDRDATLRRMLPGRVQAPEVPVRRFSPLPPVAALAVWAAVLGFGAVTGAIAPLPPKAAGQTDTAPPDAPRWQIAEGRISLAVTRLGKRIEGGFSDWQGEIAFDDTVAAGPAGTVEVRVSVSSLSLGDATEQALGPDYLDAGFFPEAVFTARIRRTENGYEATGPLVIRDTSLPVTVPFEMVPDGDGLRIRARLVLDRLDFGIGAGLPDDAALGHDVEITVTLRARRAPD